jgi:hypothetical protein
MQRVRMTERFCKTGLAADKEYVDPCMPISEIRCGMEKEARSQLKYIDILCQLFDDMVQDNDSSQVNPILKLEVPPLMKLHEFAVSGCASIP